jgi:hypothetical protein
MDAVYLRGFIEGNQLFQRFDSIGETELVGILGEVPGMDQFGYAQLHFLFVIMEGISNRSSCFNYCNHWLLI